MADSRLCFVTGTDTGVGKTLASCALLHKASLAGMSTLGLKPLAAGCENRGDGPQNQDALDLLRASTLPGITYAEINPWPLRDAMAPHIAAEREGVDLDVGQLAAHCRSMAERGADLTLVEGAGGWRVPLDRSKTSLADLPAKLQAPVILVAGMRLGCLNHALLTAEAITRDGLNLCGWIANLIDPDMDGLRENLDTLACRIDAPLLGELPWFEKPDPALAAACLDLPAGFDSAA